KREGGDFPVPGLNRPVNLDTSTLSPAEAGKLESLVAASHFFERPAVVGTPKPGAVGYFTYHITVEDNHRSHTVQLNDFTEDRELLALREFLQSQKSG